ncbi:MULTISPECIES: hypothetical protein [unclassified Okeania]|nr:MULTISPECIES: hypothetical protein [unclassified Okeania]
MTKQSLTPSHHRPRERCDPATTPVAPGSAPREKNDLRSEKWY